MGKGPSANCQSPDPSSDEFHRRDLSVRPAILLKNRTTEEYIQALGGVFKATDDQPFGAYQQPIYITSNAVTIDSVSGHAQVMCQYETASLGLFDENANVMYTVLLGGMSSAFSSAGTAGGLSKQLTDAGFIFGPPFIADGTILAWRNGTSDMHQIFLHRPFPTIPSAVLTRRPQAVMLGANAHFFLNPRIPHYENGVIQMSKLRPLVKHTLGYIYGGLGALGPNGQSNVGFADPFATGNADGQRTFASSRLFRVTLTLPEGGLGQQQK